jgi:hypothetical protein
MDAPARQRQAASESDFLDGILNCFGHRIHEIQCCLNSTVALRSPKFIAPFLKQSTVDAGKMIKFR